jgi:hypothetical protein
MKTKIYIKTAIFTLMGGLVLLSSSCLKDSRYVNYFADAPLAEFPLAEVNAYQPGGSDGAYQAIAFSDTTTSYTVTVAVKVAAPRALTSATVFTISTTDVTALNSYNTANTPALQALPATDYTVVGGLQVTVPANITEVYFKVIINSAGITDIKNGANATIPISYALPLTIENAGSIQIAIPEKYLLYNFSTF